MTRPAFAPASTRIPALGVALAVVVAVALVGCAAPTTRTTFPPLGTTPQPAGDRTDAAEAEVLGALAELGLQATESVRSYRPPEGPLLAAAPRTVLQATLPDDPAHGFIVIYAYSSPIEAGDAAEDHAAYVSTGPGRIQYPPGTRFVLRVVGPTVVFFHWSPDVATDERTRNIEDALLRIGSGVPVPA
jgi:hypothetical protein